MSDSRYVEIPLLFKSAGITARLVEDTASPEQYLNMNSVEELAENALANRLGSVLLTANGNIGGPVFPLSGTVRSIFKLGQLGGVFFRYAVTSDGSLWRIAGLNPGEWTKISSSFSGNPCSIQSFCNTDFTSVSSVFFSDSNGLFKDTGTQASLIQGGIFPPQFPCAAQSQEPTTLEILDNYTAGVGSYEFSDTSSEAITPFVATTLALPVTATGIQTVTVADPTQPGLFQLLTIDSGANQETVLVLFVTLTGFIANFTKIHNEGASITSESLTVTVPVSTTATITAPFSALPVGTKPIPSSETVYGNQSDYIGLYMFVDNPANVQSVTLSFDCGDGSFESDYFYKVIAQGPLQELTTLATTSNSSTSDPTSVLTEALLSDSLSLYGNEAGGIGELNTGLNNFTPLLFQLSDFSGAGRADYTDPVFNWANVNGYQITIVTNDNTAVTIQLASLVLFGGSGPDSLGGVAYDYVGTFFNPVDGTESNPSPLMTNQNPPNQTNWVYPRRQPVLVNINTKTFGPAGQLQDGQIGMLRVYRRGGTLGDNFRMLNQFTINIAAGAIVPYLDTAPDYQIAGAQFVSFTNDVPVPSLLPVPVNTTLADAINVTGAGRIVTITPVSMASISVRQRVTLGSPTAIQNNFETVIVLSAGTGAFTAFVQNSHAVGEQVEASIQVGQPVNGMVIAFNKAWYWNDPNNPSTLYFSTGNAPQYVGEENNIIISTPDDIITAVVPYKGNMFVSCIKSGWWMVPPDTPASQPPYPTACKHPCIAMFGYIATEEYIAYQASDGLRVFSGGASEYTSLPIEFIFQGIGKTPIVEANQSLLSQTVASFWNSMIFFSYVGVDGNRHRVIYHTQYKRFRNDDVDAQCLFLESDTNQLVYGDSNGLVHLDRQPIPFDQVNSGGALAEGPININLQTSYSFQSAPEKLKNYNSPQIDCNLNGGTLSANLLFNDGQITVPLGTFSNTQRGKINFPPINGGDGQQAYKVSLQIVGSVSAFAFLFQASIEAIVLPRTRQTLDTYDLNLGVLESKQAKNLWWQVSAQAPINFEVFYDDNPTAGFAFTIPTMSGIRNPFRQRLPGLQFRTIRIIGTSTADFLVWPDSTIEWKTIGTGKGYMKQAFISD